MWNVLYTKMALYQTVLSSIMSFAVHIYTKCAYICLSDKPDKRLLNYFIINLVINMHFIDQWEAIILILNYNESSK